MAAPIFAENNSHPLSRRRRSIVADQAETCIYCHDYTEIEANLRDETYFGLIKCLVLPPRDLLIPVLPFRANGKLLFPLCRKCVEELSKSPQTYASDVKAKSESGNRKTWSLIISVPRAGSTTTASPPPYPLLVSLPTPRTEGF